MNLRVSTRIGILVAASGVWAVAAFAAPGAAGPHDPASQAQANPRDDVATARQLATSGKRAAAVTLLKDRLAVRPDDNDARTLLGIVLSWEGRYDEARAELRTVLISSPADADALPALVSVELWSDHPEEAAALAEYGLRVRPDDSVLLVSYARACKAMNRDRAALDAVDRALEFDPRNHQALRLRESILENRQHWSVAYGYAYDWFSDGRTGWSEHQINFKRTAGWGAVLLRASQAERFGLRDQQVEADFYPRLRRGTYMYLNAGWTPDHRLYPDHRFGLHIYQSLGHGFEGSLGYTRLGFSTPVNIYVVSLSKYAGEWLLTGQTFITPRPEGTTASYHAGFRRYVGDKSYFGLRYHHGWANERVNSLNDIEVLSADGLNGELFADFGRRFELSLRAGFDRQQRILSGALTQYSASGLLAIRF